jgi:hypothetical protein
MEKIHWPLQLPRVMRVFRTLGRALTSQRVTSPQTSPQIDIPRRVDQNVAIIRGNRFPNHFREASE